MIAGASDLQWGTVGEWVAAAATFAAVLVALAGPIGERLRRPTLRLEVGITEPHVRLKRDNLSTQGFFIRVAVRNVGKSEAERVRAQITRWVYRSPEETVWRSHDLDPTFLHWTGMPHADQGRSSPPEVTIAPGSVWFLDLAYHDVKRVETRLILDDHTDRGFRVTAGHALGHFVAEVLVSAANASPITRAIGWSLDDKTFVSEIAIVPELPQAPRPGFLNILLRPDETEPDDEGDAQ